MLLAIWQLQGWWWCFLWWWNCSISFNPSFIHSFIHSFNQLINQSFIQLIIQSFIQLITRSSIPPIMYSSNISNHSMFYLLHIFHSFKTRLQPFGKQCLHGFPRLWKLKTPKKKLWENASQNTVGFSMFFFGGEALEKGEIPRLTLCRGTYLP